MKKKEDLDRKTDEQLLAITLNEYKELCKNLADAGNDPVMAKEFAMKLKSKKFAPLADTDMADARFEAGINTLDIELANRTKLPKEAEDAFEMMDRDCNNGVDPEGNWAV